jgi:hypothetical protein
VIDRLVSEQLLRALAPAAVDLSLRAVEQLQQERGRLEQLWQQRLERAHYEVERAFRQYNAVEPENRLVARALEQRWEEALLLERQLEAEHNRFLQEHAPHLTSDQRARIKALSQNLPALWESATLTQPERKEIVRLLVERVEVLVRDNKARVAVTIHWVGGHASRHEVERRVGSYEQVDDFARLKQRLLELRDGVRTAVEIAAVLNQEGFRPARGDRRMTGPLVQNLLTRLHANPLPARRLDRRLLRPGEWTVGQLSKKLGVKHCTIFRWCQVGWVHARKLSGSANRWLVWADADELARLRRLRDCPCDMSSRQRHVPELTTPKARPEPAAERGAGGKSADSGSSSGGRIPDTRSSRPAKTARTKGR